MDEQESSTYGGPVLHLFALSLSLSLSLTMKTVGREDGTPTHVAGASDSELRPQCHRRCWKGDLGDLDLSSGSAVLGAEDRAQGRVGPGAACS